MKKYKILGFLFLVLLFSVFIPTTNYKAFAENEKETKTTTAPTHKAATVKKVKQSKVKKTKKAKSTKTKTTTSTTKTPVTSTTTIASYSLAVLCAIRLYPPHYLL